MNLEPDVFSPEAIVSGTIVKVVFVISNLIYKSLNPIISFE